MKQIKSGKNYERFGYIDFDSFGISYFYHLIEQYRTRAVLKGHINAAKAGKKTMPPLLFLPLCGKYSALCEESPWPRF